MLRFALMKYFMSSYNKNLYCLESLQLMRKLASSILLVIQLGVNWLRLPDFNNNSIDFNNNTIVAILKSEDRTHQNIL